MAHQEEDSVLAGLLPLLTGETGSDNPLAQALAVLLNAAMRHEREKHLGVAAYERSSARNGQANGYKERTLSTRLGQVAVSVPQVRNSAESFRPQSLEAALLSEKALKVALAEMYVQGVSSQVCERAHDASPQFWNRFVVRGHACVTCRYRPPASAVRHRNWTTCLPRGGNGLWGCSRSCNSTRSGARCGKTALSKTRRFW